MCVDAQSVADTTRVQDALHVDAQSVESVTGTTRVQDASCANIADITLERAYFGECSDVAVSNSVPPDFKEAPSESQHSCYVLGSGTATSTLAAGTLAEHAGRTNISEALEADTCMLRGLVGAVRESSVLCDEAFAPAWKGCRCEPCVHRRALANELGTLLEMKCLEGCGGLACSEMSVELSARLRLRTEHLPIVAEVLSMTMPDLMVAMRTRPEEAPRLWGGLREYPGSGTSPAHAGLRQMVKSRR
jgi:hypothetical protein